METVFRSAKRNETARNPMNLKDFSIYFRNETLKTRETFAKRNFCPTLIGWQQIYMAKFEMIFLKQCNKLASKNAM